jgi:prenyl protein peptidase
VLSSLLSAGLTVYLIKYHHHASTAETLRLLGWWPIYPVAIAQTLLLCGILFAGPLFECGLVEGGLSNWLRGTHTGESPLSTWTGRRNLIVGPVTEELVFRSLIVPLHLMARVSATRIVFLTPLYFGIAHVHHFYEFMLSHPNFPLFPAVVRTLVQFTYTSLFGFFATFVFLRTGSVYAAIAAHIFCNWMGLPRFWGRVGAPPRIEPRGRHARSDQASVPSEEDVRKLSKRPQGTNLSAIWTLIYYSLLVAGLYGFSKQLWPLTRCAGSLAEFGSTPV